MAAPRAGSTSSSTSADIAPARGHKPDSPRQRGDVRAEFETRPIGHNSLKVTALGLGCATLGGRRVKVTPEEAEAIVHAAWAEGVRYVDCAPYYGFGQAERAVGDALRDKPRDAWVLSTKVGRLLRPLPTRQPRDTSIRCRSRQCSTIRTMA